MKKGTLLLVFSCLSICSCFGMDVDQSKLWDMSGAEFEEYSKRVLEGEFGSAVATNTILLEVENAEIPEAIEEKSSVDCHTQGSVPIFSTARNVFLKQEGQKLSQPSVQVPKKRNIKKSKKKKELEKLAQALREQAAEKERLQQHRADAERKKRQKFLRRVRQQEKEKKKQQELASLEEDAYLNDAIELAATELENMKRRLMVDLLLHVKEAAQDPDTRAQDLVAFVCKQTQDFTEKYKISFTTDDIMSCLPRNMVSKVKVVRDCKDYTSYVVHFYKDVDGEDVCICDTCQQVDEDDSE